jgi:hypothetical protein
MYFYSESHLLLKGPGTQRYSEELLKSKWPHVNEEMADRKILLKMPLNRES